MISSADKTTDIQSDIVTKIDGADFTPDASMFGGSGGTCPALPKITVFGNSYQIDADGQLCRILGWVRALVLLAAYYSAFKIVSR